MTNTVTIDDALEDFLATQSKRLSPRTMGNYEAIVRLLRDAMNNYAYTALSGLEERRWRKAFDAGDEEAYTRLFGPQKIVDYLGEFLGYFMIRKVMAGQELLRSAGTVTKKLAKWLYEQGYITDEQQADAVERGVDAARDLPRADKLGEYFYEATRTAPSFDPDDIPDEDWVEDHLVIDRVEPGEIWFEGGIGPVRLPKAATDLSQPGWGVNIVLARLKGVWHVIEVGNVYP